MHSGLPGAAQLLGAKPRLEPELAFFLVWSEFRNQWILGQGHIPALAFQPLYNQVIYVLL